LLKVFVVSTLVASLVCLGYAFHRNNYFETFWQPYWFYWSYYDLTEIIGVQPNYLAIFAGLSIIILFHFIMGSASRRAKVVMYGMILYLAGFIILLSGRTAMLAMIMIVSAGYLWYFYKTGRLLRGLFVAGGVVIVTGIVVWQIPIMRERLLQTFDIKQQTEWINQMGDGQGSLGSIRLAKWQSSLNIIKHNWLIGVSPGDTQDKLHEQYVALNFTLGIEEHYNPHNQYLQTWVALGIIGLAVFLGTLIVPFRKALAQSDYLYIAFIVLFAISCTTESVLERQVGIIFYALLNAIFLQRQNSYSLETSVNK
jgi:O-antigen ligase